MYPLYRWMYNLVGFSRSQTNGFLIFLPLLTLIVLSEPLSRMWFHENRHVPVREAKLLDSILLVWNPTTSPKIPGHVAERFAFNPNTVSSEEMQRLGFSPRVAKTIENYREKGGRFKTRDDLLRIRGMDTAFFAGIAPFVEIPALKKDHAEWSQKQRPAKKQRQPFDLNTADTTRLEAVFGIGRKLALRIFTYREALGGFVSFKQLNEVYHLDTLVIARLVKESFIQPGFTPRQIDLNVAGSPELDRHPYLRRHQSDAIVAFRFSHGKFLQVEDLLKVKAVDSVTYRKVKPYLKTGG